MPLWGSSQTTVSLGQCPCACCSVRNAVRTGGDCPQAAQDSATATIMTPEPRLRVKPPPDPIRGSALLIIGNSLPARRAGGGLDRDRLLPAFRDRIVRGIELFSSPQRLQLAGQALLGRSKGRRMESLENTTVTV